MTDPLTTTAGAVLHLGAEMTIAQAAGHRETLVDAVASAGGDLQLDLAAVSDFDSSGVQLLLSARRSLAERGLALQIVAASPAVRDALALFGLGQLLDSGAAAATH
jgi:anti-sigma B factor antagonist